MNERRGYIGHREELRARRKRVAAEVLSHRDSLRAALPVTAEAGELEGEHVVALALALHERGLELAEIDKRITAITQELGG